MKTIDRDVSWMYFNHRILEEARRDEVPVLDRLTFLGIYSNNLDEFFRVRMAFINRTIRLSEPKNKIEAKEKAALQKVQKEIGRLNARYSQEYQLAVDEVAEALRKEHIYIVDEKQLDSGQRQFVECYYRQKILGRMAPLWIDELKHLDHEADDTPYMIVRVVRRSGKPRYAIMPLPIDGCGKYQADRYLAYATSAFRDARNSMDLICEIKKKTGLLINVISGEEEARIIHDNFHTDGNLLYMDVGGGSTELSLVCDGQTLESRSVNIGTIRLLKETVDIRQWDQLARIVVSMTAGVEHIRIVGSGGNINKLNQLAVRVGQTRPNYRSALW